MNIFWRDKKREALERENETLRLELAASEAKRLKLESEWRDLTKIRYNLNLSEDDPSPVDSAERKEYIANALNFFRNSFSQKLEQLIAKAKADLGNPLNSRDYDLNAKGVINGLSQLLDWRDELESEEKEFLQGKPDNQNYG